MLQFMKSILLKENNVKIPSRKILYPCDLKVIPDIHNRNRRKISIEFRSGACLVKKKKRLHILNIRPSSAIWILKTATAFYL